MRGLAEGYLKTQMTLEHKRFTMLVTRDRGMYRRARVTSEGVRVYTPALARSFDLMSLPGVKRDEEGTTRRARASDERLCSESGARLDTQGWRQVVLSEVSTSEIQVRLTWRQEVETDVSR